VSANSHDSKLISKWHNSLSQSFFTADESLSVNVPVSEAQSVTVNSEVVPDSNTSPYSKVDKTGFIGFFATGIEIAIDFGHDIINKIGVQNSYGFSIILFTILGTYMIHALIDSCNNYNISEGTDTSTDKVAARIYF